MQEYDVTQLSPEEKATLLLTTAYRELLEYIKCGHVSFRVDLAFKSDSGVYIYSIDEGKINDKTKEEINSDAFNEDMVTYDATSEDIKNLFRKHLQYEKKFHYYMIISEGRLISVFDDKTKAYAALISYKDEVSPVELFDNLFAGLLSRIKKIIKRNYLEALKAINNFLDANEKYETTREAMLQLLSSRFYGDKNDDRREELYDTLTLLACTPYEKAQNRGRIGIYNENVPKGDAFIEFQTHIAINKGNARLIRKLLEMSDKKSTILIENNGDIVGIFSQQGKYTGTGVAFFGNGNWDLFSVGKAIISFNATTFMIKDQSFKRRMVFAIRDIFADECDIEALKTIIRSIREQSHGTTVVFTNCADEETERLAKYNRIIPIIPQKLEGRNLLSVSAIDGAIMINPYGVCYGIGAILDGETINPGNMARGARYNSAITYVDSRRKKKEKVLVVIVSADESTDIYPEPKRNHSFTLEDNKIEQVFSNS